MAQIAHASSALVLEVYAHTMSAVTGVESSKSVAASDGAQNPPFPAGSEAAGQGFEPQLPGPEPGVLPLDDPATARSESTRAA